MTDHSAFIWGSFAAAALTLLLNVWTASRARRAAIRAIAEAQAEEAGQ